MEKAKGDGWLRDPNNLLTRAEILKVYHNVHLNQLMSHKINISMFKGLDDSEIADVVPVQVPGTGEVSMREITVKKAKETAMREYHKIVVLLQAIETLLIEEGVEVEKSVQALDMIDIDLEGEGEKVEG